MNLLICAFSPLLWSALRQVSLPLKNKYYFNDDQYDDMRIYVSYNMERIHNLAYAAKCNFCKHAFSQRNKLKSTDRNPKTWISNPLNPAETVRKLLNTLVAQYIFRLFKQKINCQHYFRNIILHALECASIVFPLKNTNFFFVFYDSRIPSVVFNLRIFLHTFFLGLTCFADPIEVTI